MMDRETFRRPPLRTAAAAAFVLLVAGGGVASAQQGPPISAGTRVRVHAPSLRRDPYTGAVEALRADTIVLDTAPVRRRLGFEMGPVLVDQYRRVTIPVGSIEALEVSRGRVHRRSTIKGIIIGGGLGAVLYGFTKAPEVNPGFKDVVKGFPVGFLLGATAGGTVGYLLGGERWAQLPKSSLGTGRGGGFR